MLRKTAGRGGKGMKATNIRKWEKEGEGESEQREL